MVSKEEIVKFNKKYSTGVFVNEGNLDFALARLKLKKDNLSKASSLMKDIVEGHPFLNGNKRTAIAASFALLGTKKILDKELFADFIKKCSAKKCELGEYRNWLKKVRQ